MSSGFVSGGTADQPIQRDDEWLEAQQEIEASRRRKEEESRQAGGKSLYEVLQQNKAAKQEAFEESTRLKNQFRTLDEDEVEFLDSVLESTRAKEDAVRKETTEQLDLFRRQQEEADRALVRDSANGTDLTASRGAASPPADETNWVVSGKKRKRVQERDKEGLKGIKLKKSSSTVDKSTSLDTASPSTLSTFKRKEVPKSTQAPRRVESDQKINQSPSATSADMSTKSPAKSRVSPKNTEVPQKGTLPGLGLANYSSEDDD